MCTDDSSHWTATLAQQHHLQQAPLLLLCLGSPSEAAASAYLSSTCTQLTGHSSQHLHICRQAMLPNVMAHGQPDSEPHGQVHAAAIRQERRATETANAAIAWWKQTRLCLTWTQLTGHPGHAVTAVSPFKALQLSLHSVVQCMHICSCVNHNMLHHGANDCSHHFGAGTDTTGLVVPATTVKLSWENPKLYAKNGLHQRCNANHQRYC